jgi:chitinase
MQKINCTSTSFYVKMYVVKVACLLLFSFLFSPVLAKVRKTHQAPPMKVVGYFASWAATGAENVIQYDKFTHLIYSFGIPTTNGHLKPIEQPARLQTLLTKARTKNVKVLLAIGGWSDNGEELDPRFEAIAANPTMRKILVDDIINVVNQYGIDGIDMDWEVPDQGASYNNFLALMSELSARLKPNGKLLTAAVSAGAGWGYYDTRLNPYVDFLNVMAYDGDAGAGHSPYSFAVSAVDLWVKTRGFAAEKIILGVPFYARPSWSAYKVLLANGADPYKDKFNNDYYNGIPTIQAKVALAQTRNLGGIMYGKLAKMLLDSILWLLRLLIN